MSFRSERHAFCGDIWGFLAVTYISEKTQDCMVDQVESEPFSTAESNQQTQLGSKLVHCSIAVTQTECVNERIGNLAPIDCGSC